MMCGTRMCEVVGCGPIFLFPLWWWSSDPSHPVYVMYRHLLELSSDVAARLTFTSELLSSSLILLFVGWFRLFNVHSHPYHSGAAAHSNVKEDSTARLPISNKDAQLHSLSIAALRTSTLRRARNWLMPMPFAFSGLLLIPIASTSRVPFAITPCYGVHGRVDYARTTSRPTTSTSQQQLHLQLPRSKNDLLIV